MKCVKVPLKELNDTRIKLMEEGLMNMEYRIKASADYGYIPINEDIDGYEIADIKCEVDNERYLINVTIPEAKVLDNYIKLDDLQCVEKNSVFNPIGTAEVLEYFKGIEEEELQIAVEKGIYEFDPFAKIDEDGVGRLVEMAVELGKKQRPDIKLGICGEHGGNPPTIEFCHKVRIKLCILFTIQSSNSKTCSSTSSN